MSGRISLRVLQIAPDRVAEFSAMMAVEAPLTRRFVGCERFEVYVDASEPGRVTFFEHWRSDEDEERYVRWRTEWGDFERLGAFFTAAPVSTTLPAIS